MSAGAVDTAPAIDRSKSKAASVPDSLSRPPRRPFSCQRPCPTVLRRETTTCQPTGSDHRCPHSPKRSPSTSCATASCSTTRSASSRPHCAGSTERRCRQPNSATRIAHCGPTARASTNGPSAASPSPRSQPRAALTKRSRNAPPRSCAACAPPGNGPRTAGSTG